MKKLLKENQSDFKFQITKELSNKYGKKYKKLYVVGNTKELNNQIRGMGSSMKDEYGILYDKEVRLRWFHIKPNTAGEYEDSTQVAMNKANIFISRVNEFYEYTLGIDELISALSEYVPEESDKIVATPEQINDIETKLEAFKERIVNISSSEELQEIMQLLGAVKSGKDGTGISPLNKMKVIGQKADATYVNNRSNWLNWYKREIKDDATPIFITKPRGNSFNKDVTQQYLSDVGKKYKDLSGRQKEDEYELQRGANKSDSGPKDFVLTVVYDISDTEQIEGSHDEIGANKEKSRDAQARLGDRTLGDIDTDTQTTTDIEKIQPVYDGLLAYADAQNIRINQQGGITAPREVTAVSTKLLASAIISQMLSGQLGGFTLRAKSEAKSPSARKQQVELASWEFMEGVGIPIGLGDVDMSTIFGNPEPNKTPEQQRKAQKGQIGNVLTDIKEAVNQLLDFIKNHNTNLSEEEGMVIKPITVMKIANDLGIPSDMVNEFGMRELSERLRNRFNLV